MQCLHSALLEGLIKWLPSQDCQVESKCRFRNKKWLNYWRKGTSVWGRCQCCKKFILLYNIYCMKGYFLCDFHDDDVPWILWKLVWEVGNNVQWTKTTSRATWGLKHKLEGHTILYNKTLNITNISIQCITVWKCIYRYVIINSVMRICV